MNFNKDESLWRDHYFQTYEVDRMSSSQMVQSLIPINFNIFPVNREMQSSKTDKYVNHYA